MTGSSLAAVLIPFAGTICLAAWLTLVFHAGRDHHPRRAGSNPAPGHQGPGTAALADRRQREARPADPGRGAVMAVPPGNATGLASPGSSTTIIAATPAGIAAT